MDFIDKIINWAKTINENDDLQKKLPAVYSFLYRDVTKFITPKDKWDAVNIFEKFRKKSSKPNYKINPQMLIIAQKSTSDGIPKVIKLNNVYYVIDGFKTPEVNRLQSSSPIDIVLLNCDDLKIGQQNKTNFSIN